MATWLEKSRSPEYSPAKLSQMLAEVEAVIGIDELDEAMAHETIIAGGYLNTHLIKAKSIKADHIGVGEIKAEHIGVGEIKAEHIKANSIKAEHMDVDSLSAISADIGNVTSGTLTGAIVRTSSGGDRIQLSDNLLRAYANGKERVRLDTTALRFYGPTGAFGGHIFADTSHSYWSTIFSIQPSSTGYLSLHTEDPQTTTSGYAAIQVIPASGDSNLWHDSQIRLETRGPAGSGGYAHVELEDGWVDINTDMGLWVYGTTYLSGDLHPDINNFYDIGEANYRWRRIYLNNNPNVASDIRTKSSIQNIPNELLAELKEIKPRMYQQGEKWHFGYIAQDVERALYKYALKKVGWEKAQDYVKDFELLYKDESYLSLIYAEIAVLKEAEMQARIDELEARLLALEQAS